VPPPPWKEVPGSGLHCFGCLRRLGNGSEGEGPGSLGGVGQGAAEEWLDGPSLLLRCPLCRQLFCVDCDAFVHETLFNCPGCEVGAAAAGGDGG